MRLGFKEFKEIVEKAQNESILKRNWADLTMFFYTFKYAFDYIYSFFSKRYYGAILKINNYWYYLPDLDGSENMHYSRTLYDISDIISKSSALVLENNYEVQEFAVIVFKEEPDGDMDIRDLLIDNIDEFFKTANETIPLTDIITDLSYSLK